MIGPDDARGVRVAKRREEAGRTRPIGSAARPATSRGCAARTPRTVSGSPADAHVFRGHAALCRSPRHPHEDVGAFALLAQGGIYARLYELQYKDQDLTAERSS